MSDVSQVAEDEEWVRVTGCTEAQWRVMFAKSLEVGCHPEYVGVHLWSTITPQLWRCACGVEARE